MWLRLKWDENGMRGGEGREKRARGDLTETISTLGILCRMLTCK
jgi:hypothetical protein